MIRRGMQIGTLRLEIRGQDIREGHERWTDEAR